MQVPMIQGSMVLDNGMQYRHPLVIPYIEYTGQHVNMFSERRSTSWMVLHRWV